MRRWIKWFLFSVAAIALLLGVAVWLASRALDPQYLKSIAVEQTRVLTGRDLTIDGKVEIHFFPVPSLVAENIRVSNMEKGSRPDMVRVRHAEGRIALKPLLHGKIQIRSLTFSGADIFIETDAAGTGNWTFHADEKMSGNNLQLPEIVLDKLHIEDSILTYHDGKRRFEKQLAIAQLTLLGQTDGDRIDLTSSIDGRQFGVQGTTGRLEAWLANPVSLPFDVTLSTQGIPVALKGVLKTGDAQPALDVSASTAALDLSKFLPSPDKHPEAKPQRYLFSEANLPLVDMTGFNITANLSVEHLFLPNKISIKSLHTKLALKNGNLALQPFSFKLGGGAVNGWAKLEAKPGKLPGISFGLEGKGISLEELAADAGQAKQISGGRTDLSVNLASSGKSLHELMAGANGNIKVVVGPAKLADGTLDIGGDALSKLVSESGTTLSCAVARLPVKDGLINIDHSIAYETSKINMVVVGNINLKDESLKLAMRPDIKQGMGVGGGSLAKMVQMTGTLTKPTVSINTLGTLGQIFSFYTVLATGGASLLLEKLFHSAVDDHPCQAALAGETKKSKH